MATALPCGWNIERESAAAAVLSWSKTDRARLEVEIRYSEFGWMWAESVSCGTWYSGHAALEKWKHFAATPALAAIGAAKSVVDRLREDADDRHGLMLHAAALGLIAATTRAAADPAPEDQESWPLAQQSGRPAGYHRVAFVPEHRQDVHEVAWWTGVEWLPWRPGADDGIRRTVRSIEWPRAVVWAVDAPVMPEVSRQFDAWAGLLADQPAAPQHLPVPVLRATGPQLDLFA